MGGDGHRERGEDGAAVVVGAEPREPLGEDAPGVDLALHALGHHQEMVDAAAVLVDDMVPFPVVGGGHGRWEKGEYRVDRVVMWVLGRFRSTHAAAKRGPAGQVDLLDDAHAESQNS